MGAKDLGLESNDQADRSHVHSGKTELVLTSRIDRDGS